MSINEQSKKIVPVYLSLVFPSSPNRLSLNGYSAKTLPQLKKRVGDQFVWHRPVVIKP